MRSTVNYNYMAPTTQKLLLESFEGHLNKKALDSLRELKDDRGSLTELDKAQITKLINAVDAQIAECKKILEKPQESKDGIMFNDYRLLVTNISGISAILEYRENQLSNNAKESLQKTLAVAKDECAFYIKSLPYFLDVTAYQIQVDETTYESLLNGYKQLHLEGVVAATGHTINAIVTTHKALLTTVLERAADALDPTPAPNKSAPGLFKKADLSFGKGLLGNCLSNKRKQPIPKQCIKSWLKVQPDGELIETINPDYIARNTEEKTLFVVDADDPKKVLSQGLYYHDEIINPHGNTVFLTTKPNAKSFIHLRHMRTDLYNPQFGWRRSHPWKDVELECARQLLSEKSRNNQYLEYWYQKCIVEDFAKNIDDLLLKKLNSSNNEFAKTVASYFDASTKAVLHALSIAKVAEEKSEAPTLEHNNHLLLCYIHQAKEYLELASARLVKKYEENKFVNDFDTAIKKCEAFKHGINNAVNHGLYEIEMTTSEYQRIKKNSDAFHYTPSKLIIKAIEKATGTCIGSLNFIYTDNNKKFIPPEWIKRKLHPYSGKTMKDNPHFQKVSDDSTTIYYIDANDPNKIFIDGITYLDSSVNPDGCSIFVENIQSAAVFVGMHAWKAKMFDPTCGWRIDKDWTEQDLATVQSKLALQNGGQEMQTFSTTYPVRMVFRGNQSSFFTTAATTTTPTSTVTVTPTATSSTSTSSTDEAPIRKPSSSFGSG